MKISILLPYKENYTFSKAQAAAIWVCDFFKYSKFNENNYIFGNTKTKDYLTDNYINIPIQNKKSRFSSTTFEYCQNLISKIENQNFEISNLGGKPPKTFLDPLASHLVTELPEAPKTSQNPNHTLR